MKRMYKNSLQLCYTDTDSLLYLIDTNCFYEDNIKYFDTSNFENNQYMPKVNCKIPGFFKDEMDSDIITEFVGLRAKLYCIHSKTTSIRKAKGIKKSVTQNLNIEKYKRALWSNEDFRKSIVIRSKNHQIFTQKVDKLVLNRDDDKRQIMADGYNTLPWGHYKTIF
ncbi:unnamed protein product [Parnassius mnemosyne]|uniref:DNA-directed DNA polymerase n=1 Tax=Parnassius mnemosyne TaxID=213953 RepID=A0AAV1LTQ7_9NEOP